MMRALYVPFHDGTPLPSEARAVRVSTHRAGPFRNPAAGFAAPVLPRVEAVGMTRRQKDALDFIRSFTGEHGYAPSYREIGDALGVGRSRVAEIVKGLAARGHIRRLPGKARAIEVAGAVA